MNGENCAGRVVKEAAGRRMGEQGNARKSTDYQTDNCQSEYELENHPASLQVTGSMQVAGSLLATQGRELSFSETLGFGSRQRLTVTAKSLGVRAVEFCRQNRLAVFSSCCLFIALVAVLDTWLVIKYSDSIIDMEQNPICLFLIQQDPYDMMVFVYGKAAGNILVLTVLVGLFRYWERIAMKVTWAITGFQFSLVCYLYVISELPRLYELYFCPY